MNETLKTCLIMATALVSVVILSVGIYVSTRPFGGYTPPSQEPVEYVAPDPAYWQCSVGYEYAVIVCTDGVSFTSHTLTDSHWRQVQGLSYETAYHPITRAPSSKVVQNQG